MELNNTIPADPQRQIDHIAEVCKRIKPLVVIRSITYNHEKYLRDALEGFVMQKTDFPFVAVVHDDASTDKTAEILREYAEKYPEIILPIYENENQYSKHDGSISRIMCAAQNATGAKYVALCEGDDYWTDPDKLQRQVDFLESHPDYSMCVTNAQARNADTHEILWEYNHFEDDVDLEMSDMILKGGGYLPTASFVFKSDIYCQIPKCVQKLYVGDYPLQIWMRYKGNVRFIKDKTTIYRIGGVGSWTQRNENVSFENRKEIWKKHHKLLQVMNECTEYRYDKYFKQTEKEFQFYDCIKYNKLLEARILWFKMGLPFKKYGLNTCAKILGLSILYEKIKRR